MLSFYLATCPHLCAFKLYFRKKYSSIYLNCCLLGMGPLGFLFGIPLIITSVGEGVQLGRTTFFCGTEHLPSLIPVDWPGQRYPSAGKYILLCVNKMIWGYVQLFLWIEVFGNFWKLWNARKIQSIKLILSYSLLSLILKIFVWHLITWWPVMCEVC